MSNDVKTYRVVCDDFDNDGHEDLQLNKGDKKIVTIYDWRSIALSWFLSATSLFAAGLGIIQFV